MSICPTCEQEGLPGALFCGTCGTRLVPTPASDETADPLVGQTLNGTYFIEQKIGSGGMGDVYRAIHKSLECPVAIKIVKRGLLSDPAIVHRFQREARAASKLRHPNVIAVTDFGQAEGGTLYMVMEYVVGKSLAQLIADDAPLHERRVVNIGGQILAALAEAHAYRILHRDLKPENVMIEARRGALDSVKVLDFGIAKMMLVGAGASTLTQAGLVCGTPGYMSPEQLRGDDVDGRSDLFSVGVVLYEMLTHKLPFDVHTPMEMLHRHLTEPIPPPSGRRGRPVSPELEQLVMRALSADRDERPGSAEEMRLELMGLTLDPDASGDGTEERLPTAILPRRDSPRGVRVQGRTTGNRSEAARPAAPPPPPAPGLPSRVGKARLTPRGQPSSVTPASGGTRAPSASSVASARTPSASNVAPATGGTRSTPARGRSTTARPASVLDPAVIDRIERRVTPFLGPIAHRLVKRISDGASTPGELCRQLATFIPSRRDARDFLAASRAELIGPAGTIGKPPTPPPARATGVAWDPAILERARRDLAVHVGPLARLVVERVCARARDPEELYRLLSLEIPSEEEREEFRRTAPAAHRADE